MRKQLRFFDEMMPILQKAIETQREKLLAAAELIAGTVQADHLVYVFGAGHAGILSEELSYRAGGLVPVVPIFPDGLTTMARPVTIETQLERISGLGPLILSEFRVEPESVLILHSNSGRNAVVVEMGEKAKELGLKVIALINVSQCTAAPSLHPHGLKLIDVADIVIDNCGAFGDACIDLGGGNGPAGSTSTIVAASLFNAVMVEAAEILIERGGTPPIFRSANVDGNAGANQKWLDHYGRRLLYL